MLIPSICRRRHAALPLAVLAMMAAAAPARAGQSTGTIDLELNVLNACTVNSAATVQADVGSTGKILFTDQPGTFTSTDALLVGTAGNLSILCSPGASPVLTVGAGAHDNAGSRYLLSGSTTVAYRLFSDSARTNEITIGKQIALGTASAAAISVPIYARATNSSGGILPAGKYTDTVQIVLSW